MIIFEVIGRQEAVTRALLIIYVCFSSNCTIFSSVVLSAAVLDCLSSA